MSNRGYRYDPLRLLESQSELSELPENTQPRTGPDQHNVPIPRRRGLQRMLLASVALNAVLLMTTAWLWLKLHNLTATKQIV